MMRKVGVMHLLRKISSVTFVTVKSLKTFPLLSRGRTINIKIEIHFIQHLLAFFLPKRQKHIHDNLNR
jgi:hypothetical protein